MSPPYWLNQNDPVANGEKELLTRQGRSQGPTRPMPTKPATFPVP